MIYEQMLTKQLFIKRDEDDMGGTYAYLRVSGHCSGTAQQ